MEPISILIPTYNRERYIVECLESIFRQTYTNLQVIVYDDGSRDRTVSLVQQYQQVKLVVGDRNRGVSYARNQLLKLADTRLAAWMDSDDIAHYLRLESQYQKMQETGATLVSTWCHTLKEAKPNAWLNPPTSEPKYNTRPFASLLFDVERGREFPFNEAVILGAEDLLWIEHIEHHYGPRANVDQQLYFIRMHGDRIGVWKRRAQNRAARAKSDAAYELERSQIGKRTRKIDN